MNEIEENLMNLDLLPGNPFQKKNWKSHLIVAHLDLDVPREFNKIFNAVKKNVGSKYCCVLNFDYYIKEKDFSGNNIEAEWFIELEWSDFQKKIMKIGFPPWSSGLYFWDTSFRWGLITTHQDYKIIGGDDSFIEEFEKSYDSKEKLAKDFLKELKSGFVNIEYEFGMHLYKSIYGDLYL